MKKLINWIIYSWRSVMDSRYNPLRHILDPSIQAYFTLALFIIITNQVFRDAERNGAKWYKDWNDK